MRNRDFLLAVALAMVMFSCNTPKVFTTNVDTSKSPWTNLRFNNDPQNFQFALISDRTGGNRPGIFEEGIKKLNLMQPEFVLNIGDLLPGYTTDTSIIRRDWEEVNGIIAKLTMPFFYLPGNHDITNSTMGKVWEERFGSRYYSFVYKNCLFVVLDTNDDRDFNLSVKQKSYVLNAISSHSQVRWTFLLMHHPIWKYNTDGRFQEIEEKLKGRNYTVFAGHEHHYQQTKRNESNYIILSTTGAGNNLRGNYFGEFDHISWISMTGNGPVVANLRLDGILPENISNDQTAIMAKPMVENTTFPHVMLCNAGEAFSHGTCYFSVKNSSQEDMELHLDFFQQNQLKINQAVQTVVVGANSNKVIEVSFSSDIPISYDKISPVWYAWEMKYSNPSFPAFMLKGKSSLTIKPTETTLIDNEVNSFVGNTTIRFDHPYDKLETILSINDGAEQKLVSPIQISGNTKLNLLLRNSKNEISSAERRNFLRTEFLPAQESPSTSPGLIYHYYEGNWNSFPDLAHLKAGEKGIATNFMVQDLARRDHNWAMDFEGYLNAQQEELYCFKITAEDGCRLLMDDQIVVDMHTLVKGENVGAIALKKGLHKIRIEFFEKVGRPRLRIQTKKSADSDWQALDFKLLSH